MTPTERAREGREDGGPAFPGVHNHETRDEQVPRSGMTLRDWFAGQALAFLAHPARVGVSFDPGGDAAFAYAVADAMLAERGEECACDPPCFLDQPPEPECPIPVVRQIHIKHELDRIRRMCLGWEPLRPTKSGGIVFDPRSDWDAVMIEAGYLVATYSVRAAPTAPRGDEALDEIDEEVKSVFWAGYTLSATHRRHDHEDDGGAHAAWGEYRRTYDPVARIAAFRSRLSAPSGDEVAALAKRLQWWLDYFNDKTQAPHPDYSNNPIAFDETAIESDLRMVLAVLRTRLSAPSGDEVARCYMMSESEGPCSLEVGHEGRCVSYVEKMFPGDEVEALLPTERLALDFMATALDSADTVGSVRGDVLATLRGAYEECARLRSRLTMEGEPVAWGCWNFDSEAQEWSLVAASIHRKDFDRQVNEAPSSWRVVPLYAHPPQEQKP